MAVSAHHFAPCCARDLAVVFVRASASVRHATGAAKLSLIFNGTSMELTYEQNP